MEASVFVPTYSSFAFYFYAALTRHKAIRIEFAEFEFTKQTTAKTSLVSFPPSAPFFRSRVPKSSCAHNVMPWRKCYFLAAWANGENRSARSAGNWKLSIEQTGRENQIASARYMENDKGRTQ